MRGRNSNFVAKEEKMEIKGTQEQNSTMSCNCKVYQKRLEKMQKKYVALRKNHKKLLGVTALLTDALEEFVKGDVKTKINETLVSCSSIYPDLFERTEAETANVRSGSEPKSIKITDDKGKVYDPATESEKEYYEGFLARPKIPRTPQV